MTKHALLISWSDEDQLFIAEAPDLPGCVAHGDSREEAARNAGDAIDLWIKVAIRHGRPVPEARVRRLAV